MTTNMFAIALNLIAMIAALFMIYHGADWAVCTFGALTIQVLAMIWGRLARICELLERQGE